MSDLPVFDLHLVGRTLHPPEDFHPDSAIGQAYRAMLDARQALSDADIALQSAQAERRQLNQFIEQATVKTSLEAFGQARDRIELIGRALPVLERDLQAAAIANDQATARFNSYHSYSAAVRSWNSIVEQGLGYYENPQYHVYQWADEVKRLPAILDAFEQQLAGVFQIEELITDA